MAQKNDDDIQIVCRIAVQHKRRPVGNIMATEHSNDGGDESRRPKVRKPILEVGDEVYAAWWPDAEIRRTNSRSSWYPGRIKSVKEVDSGGVYGPTRFYDIEYDDGDELFLVGDLYVFESFDYLLDTRVDETNMKQEWMGVEHVVDENSRDEYAKVIGWYTVTIDGEVHSFSLLSGKDHEMSFCHL